MMAFKSARRCTSRNCRRCKRVMARKKKWVKKALGGKRRRRGALHRQLGVPIGKKIPLRMLRRAARAAGKLGHRARLALTLRGFGKKKRRG